MAKEENTITIKFRGDTAEFNNSVNNINKMLKSLGSDTTKLMKQIKLDPTNAKLYNQAIENLNAQYQLANEKARQYNETLEKYSAIQKSGRKLTDEEVVDLSSATVNYNEATKAAQRYSEQLKQVQYWYENMISLNFAANLEATGKSLNKLVGDVEKIANSTKAISLGAAAILGGSIKSAIDFEDAMANVKKVLRDEDVGFLDTIRQDILDMSREIPMTAEGIAEVVANSLQLGVPAQYVSEFAETIIKLGTATNITADEASIAIAQFFNIMGESLENVDKFGASLVNVGNKFPSFESGIMDMATRLAAAASSVGFTSEQVIGLSTALVSTGLNAESGASAISTILRNIDQEVALNGKHLETWAAAANMSVEEFRLAWTKDASGTFQQIINQLNEAVTNGDNLNVTMSDLGITSIRQTDAFSRLVGAADVLNSALYESEEAWRAIEEGENGALNEEFENKIQTTAARLQLLKNDLKYIAIKLGDAILPYLNRLLEWLKGVLKAISEMSPKTQEFITKLLIGLARLFPTLKLISSILKGVGSAYLGIAGIIQKAIASQKFSGPIKVITSLLQKVSAIITGPIGIAIAGLVAGFILVNKTSEDFRNKLKLLTDDIKNRFNVITGDLITKLMTFYEWFKTKMMVLLQTVVDYYHNWLEPALAYLYEQIIQVAGTILGDLWQAFSSIVMWVIDKIKPAIDLIIDILNKYVIPILSVLISTFITIVGWLIKIFGKIWDFIKPAIEWAIKIIGGALGGALDILIGTITVIFDVIGWIIEKLGNLWDYLVDIGVIDAFNLAWQGILNVFTWIEEKISSLWNGFKDLINKALEFIGLGSQIDGTSAKLGGISSSRFNGTVNVNATTNIHNPTSNVSAATGNAINNTIDRVVNKKLGLLLDM